MSCKMYFRQQPMLQAYSAHSLELPKKHTIKKNPIFKLISSVRCHAAARSISR